MGRITARREREIAEIRAERRRAAKTQFLCDANVEITIVRAIRALKGNVKTVFDLGVQHQSDESVYAIAWKHRRVLVTHDRQFFSDDTRFPLFRCPGVLELPPKAGMNVRSFPFVQIGSVIKGGKLWSHTKMRVNADGSVIVRTFERNCGKIAEWRANFQGAFASSRRWPPGYVPDDFL